MIVTIKPKSDIENNISYFKATCTKCFAEFVFDSTDISAEKRLGGARWIHCPECGNCIYWSDSHINDVISTITKEEYDKYVSSKEEQRHPQ